MFGLSTACLRKYCPTGPSSGVKGSMSPHATSTGQFICGSRSQGLGPGGPGQEMEKQQGRYGAVRGRAMLRVHGEFGTAQESLYTLKLKVAATKPR